jgi:hypothetical protein
MLDWSAMSAGEFNGEWDAASRDIIRKHGNHWDTGTLIRL